MTNWRNENSTTRSQSYNPIIIIGKEINTKTRIKTNQRLTEEVPVSVGIPQGDNIRPTFFSLVNKDNRQGLSCQFVHLRNCFCWHFQISGYKITKFTFCGRTKARHLPSIWSLFRVVLCGKSKLVSFQTWKKWKNKTTGANKCQPHFKCPPGKLSGGCLQEGGLWKCGAVMPQVVTGKLPYFHSGNGKWSHDGDFACSFLAGDENRFMFIVMYQNICYRKWQWFWLQFRSLNSQMIIEITPESLHDNSWNANPDIGLGKAFLKALCCGQTKTTPTHRPNLMICVLHFPLNACDWSVCHARVISPRWGTGLLRNWLLNIIRDRE